MILEEVVTLTNRLKKQTTEERQESNEITIKLNDLTKRIKTVTRSMMAKVSELSMHQALAMNLFQEKTDKEGLVENIKVRLNLDDIPVEFIEKELIKAEKQRQARAQKLAEAQERARREGQFVQMWVVYEVIVMTFE